MVYRFAAQGNWDWEYCGDFSAAEAILPTHHYAGLRILPMKRMRPVRVSRIANGPDQIAIPNRPLARYAAIPLFRS